MTDLEVRLAKKMIASLDELHKDILLMEVKGLDQNIQHLLELKKFADNIYLMQEDDNQRNELAMEIVNTQLEIKRLTQLKVEKIQEYQNLVKEEGMA